jgi:hypothetical protein
MSKAAGTSLVRRVAAIVAASTGAVVLLMPSTATAAPTSVTPPTINGTLEVAQTLTATTGTWSDTSPIVSYAYQWLRCNQDECSDIDYATASAYTLPWSLAGVQARMTVTATDAQGEGGVASSEVTDVITYDGSRYNVSESTVGAGSVTGYVTGPAPSRAADANLSCPGACGALYPYVPGTRIELIATPAAGSTFVSWSGACSGSALTCSLTLGGDEAAMAIFTGQAATSPALGSGGEPREAPASGSAGAPVPDAQRMLASSITGRPARLLRLHALHHGVQAIVRCQEARPCRLSLTLVAGTRGGYMIAQRSLTIAPGRSARIRVALSRAGERLLAERRRLPVVARLTLSTSDRAILLSQGHLTLTA